MSIPRHRLSIVYVVPAVWLPSEFKSKLSQACVVTFVSVVSAVSAAGAGGPQRNWRAPHVGRRPSAAPRGHRPDATQDERRRDETRRDDHAHPGAHMPLLLWFSTIDTTYSTDPRPCFCHQHVAIVVVGDSGVVQHLAWFPCFQQDRSVYRVSPP